MAWNVKLIDDLCQKKKSLWIFESTTCFNCSIINEKMIWSKWISLVSKWNPHCCYYFEMDDSCHLRMLLIHKTFCPMLLNGKVLFESISIEMASKSTSNSVLNAWIFIHSVIAPNVIADRFLGTVYRSLNERWLSKAAEKQ